MKKEDNTAHWYAFYTKPRAEKKIAERFDKAGLEYYLPLLKTLKMWSDRKKVVMEPLFRSYIFVKTPFSGIAKILHTEGIMKVIQFGGVPQSIPDEQLKYLKLLLESPEDIEINAHLQPGEKVRVTAGPLAGAEGVLVRNASRNFVVNIDIVGHSVAVSILPAYLEKV